MPIIRFSRESTGSWLKIYFTHQLFSFSDGLIFKAIDRFLIQFRLREFDLRIVAETANSQGANSIMRRYWSAYFSVHRTLA
jgi:hypothetical protein